MQVYADYFSFSWLSQGEEMQELSKSQKSRLAIRTFKILADSLLLQGAYKPSGKAGEKLEEALRQISPEIYGSMNDSRIVELKGLEYVIDRMPKGIENCSRIILTAQEDFQETSFEKIVPLKRRRVSYQVSEREICFVITTGKSEIYDILTHITFLNIEAQKIFQQVCNRVEGVSPEWSDLEKVAKLDEELSGDDLEQAIWNLSIILGRTYKETKESYDYFEFNRRENGSNNGLFKTIYGIGKRVLAERAKPTSELTIYFTPSLHEMIDLQKYAALWAKTLKNSLLELGLHTRPIHIISANMHSFSNILYGPGSLMERGAEVPENLYDMVKTIKDCGDAVTEFAYKRGFTYINDESEANIDVNIIDLSLLQSSEMHPGVKIDVHLMREEKPVLVVIDYAFGTQAFDIMDELLSPLELHGAIFKLDIKSISIMGKAGILPGKKGDIMLATAHVIEGAGDNYRVENDLRVEDFNHGIKVYVGPMVTVLGTSLQNRDILEKFHKSSWKAVGLEMEGGHYQRAISGAVIQGHIPATLSTRYAYYASDNPMLSGQTLASGPMGEDGIIPTYMITKVLLERICNHDQ